MQFINRNRPFSFHADITEWDIASGNTSILREFSLLPEDRILALEALEKHDRHVQFGKYMQKHPELHLGRELEKGFTDMVQLFLRKNGLTLVEDVLSVKKDAVFVINHQVKEPQVTPNVLFRPKNSYHAYIQSPPLELYFGEGTKVDVKGIGDAFLPPHEEGMLTFFRDLIQLKENGSRDRFLEYAKDFVSAYKMKELEFPFYREFRADSYYRLEMGGEELLLENITKEMLPSLNIRYNYETHIIRAIRLLA